MRAFHSIAEEIPLIATYISPSAVVHDRAIEFGPEAANNKVILQLSLGSISPKTTIVVTVGLDKSHPNTAGIDSDLRVAISDGIRDNSMWIVDKGNYNTYPPCYPDGATQDNRRVASDTEFPSTFKLTFNQYYKYGACETAQGGGYINTGTFSTALLTDYPLYLELCRDSKDEKYFIHYLKVELVD